MPRSAKSPPKTNGSPRVVANDRAAADNRAANGRAAAADFTRAETYAKTRAPVDCAWTLNPAAYRDDGFFEIEKRRVFESSWVVIGRSENVKTPGYVVVGESGGQSVFAVRGEDGILRAFHNVCRHRGSQLFTQDGKIEGKYIRCPYHGWGYATSGECKGTPLFTPRDNAKSRKIFSIGHLRSFDRAEFGLLPVAVGEWGGFVFANAANDAPPLAECVGDLPTRLAAHRLDEWICVAQKEYEIDANWKLLAENAIEYYHLPWVHPRLAKTSRVQDHGRWQGDGMYCGILTRPLTSTDDSDWLQMPPMAGLVGDDLISGYFFALFPNLIFFVMPSHAFVIRARPLAPAKTIETAWLMTHPKIAAQIKPKTVAAVLDFWDQVNLEDVAIVSRVQRGLSNRAYPGGRMCYRFEEPVHRFQNLVVDAMLGERRIPPGDERSGADFLDYARPDFGAPAPPAAARKPRRAAPRKNK